MWRWRSAWRQSCCQSLVLGTVLQPRALAMGFQPNPAPCGTGHSNFEESTEAVLTLECADCGKPCRSQTEQDLHTKRTGHSDFRDKARRLAWGTASQVGQGGGLVLSRSAAQRPSFARWPACAAPRDSQRLVRSRDIELASANPRLSPTCAPRPSRPHRTDGRRAADVGRRGAARHGGRNAGGRGGGQGGCGARGAGRRPRRAGRDGAPPPSGLSARGNACCKPLPAREQEAADWCFADSAASFTGGGRVPVPLHRWPRGCSAPLPPCQSAARRCVYVNTRRAARPSPVPPGIVAGAGIYICTY